MSRANISSRYSGFTLVEMLIIAPIALLVITGFIALMVTMVGDALVSRSQNAMTYDVQSAINTIERDVRLSTEFLVTTSTLPSPQGKNGATSAFTSTSTPGDLILGTIATDKNPIDPTRRFVHYNTPNSCTSDTAYQNRIFFTTVIYTIRDNSLWRRTYVPTPSGTLCQSAWQINTCAPGYSSAATQCKANDSEILKNVKTFNIEYFINPEDTVPISSAAATTASSLRVTIETEQSSAGRTVGATSSGRATKLSSQEINLAPPDAPVVTGSNSGTDAVFSWASVPTASSYIIKYNINGGSWKTASENSTETTFSIPANHGDTISVEVMARNTTGASAKATASTSIPLWNQCGLINGWVDYAGGYSPCGYTKTKDGVVMLQGLIKDGTTGTINLFRLPEGYRPASTVMFTTIMSGSATTRLQISAGGWVTLVSGTASTAGYLSLSGIQFIPGNTTVWNNLTPLNGWQNYNAAYSSTGWTDLSSYRDPSGRVHIRGLVKQGTYTTGTPIANLPTDSRPSEYYHIANHGGPGTAGQSNLFGITTTGDIVARGINSDTYYSVQAMFYPSSHTGWTNFTTVAGAPASGQMGNSWTYYASGYPFPAYTKSADGVVTVRGLVKGGVNGSIVAVLPLGYRPTNRIIIASTANTNYTTRIDVTSAGQIIAIDANTTWTAINFSFRASD